MEALTPVLIFDGRYRLFPDGKIYSTSMHKFISPFIQRKQKRITKKVVLTTEKGKQSCFSLHLLVAKYFIPNPNNYSHVLAKDDDYTNCDVANLYWSPTRLSGHFCSECGATIKTSDTLCRLCKKKLQRRKEFENIALDTLSPENRDIISMYLNGDSYEKIGQKYGYSREMIHHFIKRANLNVPVSTKSSSLERCSCELCGCPTSGERLCSTCQKRLSREQEFNRIRYHLSAAYRSPVHSGNLHLCAEPHHLQLLHLHPAVQNALSGRSGHSAQNMRYTSPRC